MQSVEEVRQKAEASVAKAESRAMALQQQLVLLQLRLQEQGQLIRESTHQEARLESQLQEIRMELKVTETREHELRALAAQLEVGSLWHAACSFQRTFLLMVWHIISRSYQMLVLLDAKWTPSSCLQAAGA